MAGGNIRVLQFLDGKRPSRVVPEPTEREQAAIGLVTVQWGLPEHLILMTTNENCRSVE
jgi:hypothetical protein